MAELSLTGRPVGSGATKFGLKLVHECRVCVQLVRQEEELGQFFFRGVEYSGLIGNKADSIHPEDSFSR
ncbi:hypothetical protein BT69DRAFT_1281374 [Atractiella rhizophila]|nr:hypothetical protein BT69DRAFT_1281374 [Atractiella rhizophila]